MWCDAPFCEYITSPPAIQTGRRKKPSTCCVQGSKALPAHSKVPSQRVIFTLKKTHDLFTYTTLQFFLPFQNAPFTTTKHTAPDVYKLQVARAHLPPPLRRKKKHYRLNTLDLEQRLHSPPPPRLNPSLETPRQNR